MKRSTSINTLSANDLSSMRAAALEHGEACCVVARGPRYRISVAVKDKECSVEVLLRLVTLGKEIDLAALETGVGDAGFLVSRGYELGHHDEVWLCCEKKVMESDIPEEISGLAPLLEASR